MFHQKPKLINAVELAKKLALGPHPEGGFFAEVHRSEHSVRPQSPRYDGEERRAGTLIYYLLQEANYSAWHRLRSDETWHFHKGCTIHLHIIDREYNFKTVVLGDLTETEGAIFHATAKAGCWFAAELTDKSSFSLVSCAVYPGFEFKDFELADKDTIETLVERCPDHEETIRQLAHASIKHSAQPK